eukprot:TRINITY_DN58026_c0_g1_i1.p1 TRINITY_DN58026_c0_g1~~TRINITY_DN58026_c0_g1_i1.p1  ORF type:complete len:120 (+),score=11.77 TRINITY_DN58026_c0_g1_i1:195-554(+)
MARRRADVRTGEEVDDDDGSSFTPNALSHSDRVDGEVSWEALFVALCLLLVGVMYWEEDTSEANISSRVSIVASGAEEELMCLRYDLGCCFANRHTKHTAKAAGVEGCLLYTSPSPRDS